VTASSRSLATVLFTDIVGSTERATELGDREWRKLLDEHHTRVRRELRRFGGRELNTAGDGFLAVFQAPAMAVACADAIRSTVRDLGLEVRCGIHLGEVEGTGKTVGGIGVHIAARVMAEAAPGEVLVSRSVRDAVEGAGFEFEDRGSRPLKGVTGERRLYAVTVVPTDLGKTPSAEGGFRDVARRPWALGAAAAALVGLVTLYAARRDTPLELTPEEAIAADAAPGIAVLPFTVNDPALATWREGMVDLMTVNLDGVPGLRPIASRTVLARWRSEAPEVADLGTSLLVARRTGARYALIGSAVAVGGEVRFSADIYEARTGDLLGSAQAQGSPDSVLALVDRLALGVVRELPEGKDGVLPRVHLEDVTTASLPALKSYLEGEALFRRGNMEGATAAYERAVSADSTFALALFRLSLVCAWEGLLGRCGGRWAEYDRRAMAHFDRLPPRAATLVTADHDQLGPLRELLRESPDDAEAWHVLGESYEHAPGWALIIDREEEAERAFHRAIELDPGFASYYWHSIYYALNRADSARAFSLIETHGRLAPGSDQDRSFRLALALGFGDSASRGRALASLDTVETGILVGAARGLMHPSNFPIATEVQRTALKRPDAPIPAYAFLFFTLFDRGQFDAAMEVLDNDPIALARPPFIRKINVFHLYRAGMDLSPDQLAREFALTAADTTSDGTIAHFVAGVVAADQGKWRDHEAVLGRAQGEVRRRRAVGDTTAARMFDGVARALQGYALWKQGHPAEALPLLQVVQRDILRGEAGLSEGFLNTWLRWWLGQLLVELDRPREALAYFQTGDGFEHSLDHYESARIHHELGEFDEARESYEHVLVAWRDADPELRPRIETAREGLARLPKPLRRERS
jgi:class 3 adenylate cyclase/tetratricopeptide (TPR) repeat protein